MTKPDTQFTASLLSVYRECNNMYSLMSMKDNRAAVWFTVQTIVQGMKLTVGIKRQKLSVSRMRV